MYKKYIKRLIDIILSLLLIITLLPLIILISIIEIFNIGFPIIFKQSREGKNKMPFNIYKFRTLKINYNNDTTTKFTRFLRKTGLDELPQLFNILKGDMSFIGPRPFLINDSLPDDYIDPIRYTVKPGIFGLAQANGRREIEHHEKLKYDVEYTKNISFLLDFKCFFKTIYVVIIQSIKG